MLRLSQVTKIYAGGVHALQAVSLDIPAGLFGLLGPNGAGKSTLMRTIATLQSPDSGTLQFGAIDVLQDKMGLRRVLGYLPQEFGSYPRTPAEMMLRHFAALKGIYGPDQRGEAERLLVLTNLWDVRKRSVDTFSGGMKQRFGIAQALLGNPRLVIVDEPTAGLDPAERRRFQNLLVDMGQDRVVILSTHLVDDVADLCPRLAIMGQGRILAEGRPTQLVDALADQLWTTMVRRDQVAALRAQHQVLSCRLKSGNVEVRVLAANCPPGMDKAVPTLEDVYFATLHQHGLAANPE
ncbi:MAG: ABC transporter ATP-binding protein [Steroidobacteraceae bacterium]